VLPSFSPTLPAFTGAPLKEVTLLKSTGRATIPVL
jgi:hypothetical protein